MKSSEMSEQSALIWHFVRGLFDLSGGRRGDGEGKHGNYSKCFRECLDI